MNDKLFKHMAEEHDVILLESEIDEIERIICDEELPRFLKWFVTTPYILEEMISVSFVIEEYNKYKVEL